MGKHVSNSKKIARAKFMRHQCILCGELIGNDTQHWSVEHFIPRALAKWCPSDKVDAVVYSDDNIFIVHKDCNEKKDSLSPTVNTVENFYADEEILSSLRRMCCSIADEISKYNYMKYRVCKDQNHRCYICGRYISVKGSTMRRIDNEFERDITNAMCVCSDCNIRARGGSQKHRLVRRAQRRKQARGQC